MTALLNLLKLLLQGRKAHTCLHLWAFSQQYLWLPHCHHHPNSHKPFNTFYSKGTMNDHQQMVGMDFKALAVRQIVSRHIDRLDLVEQARVSTVRIILRRTVAKEPAQTEKDGK
jgi:hypothetical protein